MTDLEVERALGQTPCVCGDLGTWHPRCYRGKSDAELAAGYKSAMRKARAFLNKRAKDAAVKALLGLSNPHRQEKTNG